MNFRRTSRLSVIVSLVSLFFVALVCYAAYNHQGDSDSAVFRTAYPNAVGTKLDSCTTCHSGGSYVSGGKTTTLGSCQWCHYVTNYGADLSDQTLLKTLNSYGIAYKDAGRNASALQTISGLDSDADGFANGAEIA
ncbi:MAG: putative rane protein, partial [Deltaproteobacteria bacterium]|nr:putative rane protein [Deltaproteobacteria bacterium]